MHSTYMCVHLNCNVLISNVASMCGFDPCGREGVPQVCSRAGDKYIAASLSHIVLNDTAETTFLDISFFSHSHSHSFSLFHTHTEKLRNCYEWHSSLYPVPAHREQRLFQMAFLGLTSCCWCIETVTRKHSWPFPLWPIQSSSETRRFPSAFQMN